MPDTLIAAEPGLANIIAADTAIGDVRGDEGYYHYGRHSAVDLARTRTFEDVWFLFTHGRLPSAAESADFRTHTAGLRAIPADVAPMLRAVALAGAHEHPLAGLRTMLSAIAAAGDLPPMWDADEEQRRRDALYLSALTPTVLAALHRIRQGFEPVEPDPALPAAANWLYMVTGRQPEPRHARAVEQYLISTIDHGFNASTFTARVVASTGTDVAAAICAAVGSFSGPLHGGAPDRALEALDAIGDPANATAWAQAALARRERIMGFGHAVYRTADPRAELLKSIAVDLGGELVERAISVERDVTAVLAEHNPDRALRANVEFYAGVVMELCGLPRTMFTPTFAVSRVVGWSAHILEQAQSRKIIRPRARYVGPAPHPTQHVVVPAADIGADAPA